MWTPTTSIFSLVDVTSKRGEPFHVSGNVSGSLIPNVEGFVLPPMVGEEGVNVRPPDFGIPQPKCCGQRGLRGPRGDVWLVPVRQLRRGSGVLGEAAHAVGPVGNDGGGGVPGVVEIEGIAAG